MQTNKQWVCKCQKRNLTNHIRQMSENPQTNDIYKEDWLDFISLGHMYVNTHFKRPSETDRAL